MNTWSEIPMGPIANEVAVILQRGLDGSALNFERMLDPDYPASTEERFSFLIRMLAHTQGAVIYVANEIDRLNGNSP